jgi:hypothetical protein
MYLHILKYLISNFITMQSKFRIVLGIFFKIILIILVLSKMCVPLHSHEYYRFINTFFFSLCIGEMYLSIMSINYIGLVIAAISALIFNPFIRWHFLRHTWNTINMTCAIFLFIWIVFDVIFYVGELKFRKKFKQHIGFFDRI